MPIPSRPHSYRCPTCGWTKTVVPRSDVLMPGIDHFDACPACGHRPLETQAARVPIAELVKQIKLLLR